MAKQFFQSWLPSAERIAQSKVLSIFGRHLMHPQIWYINRRSITKAMFLGTFFGMIPIPFHTVMIVLLVLLMRVNLPLSLAMSWLTNPLTLIPILYAGFWTGAQIFQVQMIDRNMLIGVMHQISDSVSHLSAGQLDLSLAKILMVGLVTVAFVTAIVLSTLTALFWRYSVQRAWRKRRQALNET